MSNLATVTRLSEAASQFPASWYCDPRVFDAEMRTLFPRAPGYVGHELMVPEPGDYFALLRATTRRRWCATPAASSCCRTSAGIARRSCCKAAATRPTSSARCIAGPTTSRASCSARRISRQALRRASRARRCATGTACCSTARATRRATWPGSTLAKLDFSGYHVRPRADPRVQLQLEDVHRGLPRGLPRRAVPSGPRPVRHLRRPRMGVRRLGERADRRRQQRPRQARHRAPTSAGTRRCSTSTAARCRRTARSGSPTTPT